MGKRREWLKENGTYEKFLKMKEEGTLFDFKEITYPQLFDIYLLEMKSNRMIAELFDVTPNQVSYKRTKWDLHDNKFEESLIKNRHHFKPNEFRQYANKMLLLQDLDEEDEAI